MQVANFVVQMGSAGQACIPAVTNQLSLLYIVANSHCRLT